MSHKFLVEPEERVRQLSKHAASLAEVDFGIPLSRYYRASKEVVRIAQYYEKENCLENAFVLYSKYITLYVEKFPHHPHYKKVDGMIKQTNLRNLNEVFTKAESVKQQLIQIYSTEFDEAKKAEAKLVERQCQGQSKFTNKESEELKELEERFKLLKEQQNSIDSSSHKTNVQVGSLEEAVQSNNLLPATTPPPAYASAVCDSTYPPRNYNFENFSPQVQTKSMPTFDRSLKPSLGNSGLKIVCVPSNLAQEFLDRVQLNTEKNIETCGILCGRPQQNRWHITHMLIPNQFGKSDSCDIENDEEIVEFQDTYDLITLGWIHTHPSQTAFLSSVDQHTHWPYQKLLPEAISIVCAPKFKETGYFHLTPDFGMKFVQKCKGQGFHEHPIKPAIFQAAPHIQLQPLPKVIVEDLRRNRK